MIDKNKIISELRDFAKTAQVACEEHISCLRESLEEVGADEKDIKDQIGNWQWLLEQANQAVTKATTTLKV